MRQTWGTAESTSGADPDMAYTGHRGKRGRGQRAYTLVDISATDIIQAMTMLICLITLPIWWQVGRRDARFKYLRWLVLVPSLLTIAFYVTVVFLHWNELNPIEAVFISALLRLYIMSLVLYAGIWILKFISGSRHE